MSPASLFFVSIISFNGIKTRYCAYGVELKQIATLRFRCLGPSPQAKEPDGYWLLRILVMGQLLEFEGFGCRPGLDLPFEEFVVIDKGKYHHVIRPARIHLLVILRIMRYSCRNPNG